MPPLFAIRLAPQKLQTEMVSQDFRCQLEGYGLTAANFYYVSATGLPLVTPDLCLAGF